MSWELPWVKKPGNHGGFVIASVHQQRNEADITDTYMDSAYVCEEHADMIVKAVNAHASLEYAYEFFRHFVDKNGLGQVIVYDQNLNPVKIGDVFGPDAHKKVKP